LLAEPAINEILVGYTPYTGATEMSVHINIANLVYIINLTGFVPLYMNTLFEGVEGYGV
jgi:hypothetical protein